VSEPYQSIEHIVVLMQENRSFDNMLGWQFGLSEALWNRADDGEEIHVWRDEGTGEATMTMPSPDPGELFVDMNYQFFEEYFPAPGARPTMGGFVRNYQNQAIAACQPHEARAIMHCFQPAQVPATSQLAASFAVCDPWFASAPCQTWPNRFFVHTATAQGYVNNLPTPPAPPWDVVHRFPYDMPTIFNQIKDGLLDFDQGWRIYFHDFPQSLLLSRLWPHLDHFHPIERFAADVASGTLQPYSFIEPRYYPNLGEKLLPNDHHPPHDVTYGEQLVAQVYNTLRANLDLWQKTLLIVTWDEHGGCYDHVPPLAPAAPPGPPYSDGFTFDRFGARVPALVVSPLVPAGSRLAAPGAAPFDHTTIMATVRKILGITAGPLTGRDAAAPDLTAALTLGPGELNLGPEAIAVPAKLPTPGEVAAAARAPLTDFQRGLLYAAAALPPQDRLLAWIEAVRTGVPVAVAPLPHRTPEEALPYIQDKLNTFLLRDVREGHR